MIYVLGALTAIAVIAVVVVAAYSVRSIAEIANQLAHSESAARSDISSTLDRITSPAPEPDPATFDPLDAESLLAQFGNTDWTDELDPPSAYTDETPDLDWEPNV